VKVSQRRAQNDDHLAAMSFAEFIEGCSFFIISSPKRYRETELPHVKCGNKFSVLKCQHTVDFAIAGDT
jgi:hypothetical protein